MTVCILGNGLTALTLAKALTNQNIYVDILCNKKKLNINKTRTIGISKSNADFLNKNVIDVHKVLWKINKIKIFKDNLKKEKLLNFEKDTKQVFSIVKNFELYRLLENDLSKNKYFKLKLINNKNLSYIDKYDLIVNCDPHNVITKKYFIKKIIKKYNSNAYTTIITHKKILNDTAIQIFTNKGPLAFLPVSNSRTSVVYSIPNSFTNASWKYRVSKETSYRSNSSNTNKDTRKQSRA